MSAAREAARAARAGRYKPYPAYKDSGVEWLGEIPAHWDVKRLKRVFRAVNGSTPASGEPAFWDGDIPWVTPEDLGDLRGTVIHETRRSITKAGYQSCGTTLVPAGSLVLSTRAPIGHLALASVDLCTNQGCRSLVFRRNQSREYFFHELVAARPELESLGQGSTFRELAKGMLEDVGLAEPPEPEQHAIAAFLDRETARIDALVAKKERLIALLQEQRTALITRAVTKGLDPTVPMKDSGVEWLGDVARYWEVKRIKFIGQVGNGSTPNRDNSEYWGGEYPWLNSSVVNLAEVTQGSDFVTDLALGGCHLPRIHPPAVLVGITGEGRTRGMATVLRIEATINQHLAFIRPTGTHSDAEYVRYVLHAAYQFLRDESGGGGSTKGALTCDQLGNVSIPFPPIAEQRAIAAFLDRETARIDALVAKVREAIDRLKELRTALISAAVTGKIDVREEGEETA